MSTGRAKKIRNMARLEITKQNLPDNVDAEKLVFGAVARIKKRIKKRQIKSHMSKNVIPFSKKMHEGESLMDFKNRRAKSNKKRRKREKV